MQGDRGESIDGVIGEEFGGRLCFWGGIDMQHTLPFGTPQDVENEVTQRILELGLRGGYVLSASHNIQNDVDPENVFAMFESARWYPL